MAGANGAGAGPGAKPPVAGRRDPGFGVRSVRRAPIMADSVPSARRYTTVGSAAPRRSLLGHDARVPREAAEYLVQPYGM